MPIYIGDTTNGRQAAVLQSTGSTWFGNSADDLHNFQGLVYVTGTMNVTGSVSGGYVATIDNDESSAGHVLKLTTDGNGSGTRVLEMEDGDGDIIFRARADGRFGFGPDGVDSMGAGTFVVGIDNSSHTSDIAISKRLQHLGDGNTYLDFPSNDTVNIVAGGNSIIKYDSPKILLNNSNADIDVQIMADDGNVILHTDAGTNKVGIGTTSPDYALDVAGDIGVDEYIYHNGDTDTFIRFQTDDITVKAGNVSFINITEDDSQDKISFNEGRGDVDFIVRSPNESLALYLNAGNEVFHINHGESAFKTKIHSTNGEAITINSDGVILNEDGAAANDFRVESDSNTHMFFVDAGNEKTGIGTSSPIAELDVSGSIAITAESSTPSQPSDGQGYLYAKSDGKIYWRSYDVSETDLTAGGGSGAPTDAQYVTLATDGTLSGERVLTAGDNVTLTDAGAGGAVTVASHNGWHGSQTRIKLIARDFVPNDDNGYFNLAVDDATLGIQVMHATLEVYAYVPIPTGYTATHVRVYSSATSMAVGVYEAFIDGTAEQVKGTGDCSAEIDITDVSSSTTNMLVVKVGNTATSQIIYGGYVTISKD